MDQKVIGKRLRELRGKKSAEEVSNDLNISVSTIYMWENGERIPRDEMKVRLAKYYDRSVESIFFAS